MQNGKQLRDVILRLNEVKQLKKDIKTNGGLRERIIVKEVGPGEYVVVEGNVRYTLYGALHQEDPDDPCWQTIPARILPKDITDKEIAILLSDFHVAGKIEWHAHEKAGQVHHLSLIHI